MNKIKAVGITWTLSVIVLCIVYICITSLASATTVTTTEQINVTIVTVENSTVNTIMVGGLLYACSGGECVAYAAFDYECPDCPTCPVVNFAALEANLTTTLESIFKAHNSTTLNEEDKDWLKKKLGGETIAGVKAEIEEVMKKTIVVKQGEINNLTIKNEGLREDIWELRSTINAMNSTISEKEREIDGYEKEEERSRTTLYLVGGMAGIALVILVIVVVLNVGESFKRRNLVLRGRSNLTLKEREEKEKLEEIEGYKHKKKMEKLDEEMKSLEKEGGSDEGSEKK